MGSNCLLRIVCNLQSNELCASIVKLTLCKLIHACMTRCTPLGDTTNGWSGGLKRGDIVSAQPLIAGMRYRDPVGFGQRHQLSIDGNLKDAIVLEVDGRQVQASVRKVQRNLSRLKAYFQTGIPSIAARFIIDIAIRGGAHWSTIFANIRSSHLCHQGCVRVSRDKRR